MPGMVSAIRAAAGTSANPGCRGAQSRWRGPTPTRGAERLRTRCRGRQTRGHAKATAMRRRESRARPKGAAGAVGIGRQAIHVGNIASSGWPASTGWVTVNAGADTGKAIVLTWRSSARRRQLPYQDARSSASRSLPACHTGPAVCITYSAALSHRRNWSFPATRVGLALLRGKPDLGDQLVRHMEKRRHPMPSTAKILVFGFAGQDALGVTR